MDAVQIWKAVIFSIRTCYRSVCRHPFLVGVVIFLFYLYRSFPFMFSLLVSASPVLVSTAVLLGTLLSFGQPNIPEIEKEEETTTHEVVSLKTAVPRDAIIVERDQTSEVERYTDIRRDVAEKSIEKASSIASDFSDVDKADTLANSALQIKEKSKEFQFETRETEKEERKLGDTVFEKKNDLNEVKEGDDKLPGTQYSPIKDLDDKNLGEVENDKSPEVSETVDRISPQGSLWKQEDEGEDDDDVSDYGSDGAESSSPDASMADIIPMLDELHPLLDEDAPQPAHISHEGSESSDSASENSSNTFSRGSNELEEDLENLEEELEVGDDEDEEEGAHVDKEDETKSAITWTEDDQKNLMDLGTSELERNQRLENLIARRRLRKSMKIMAEKNLIDLDSADVPFNVSRITTTRHNPFDLPYDQNDDMGLPPIPGSAPSILVPRRNPFDLPYDSSEEKPDLMGDDFQQDTLTLQPKDPFFRRTGTFNVGSSFFGTSRHDYNKFRPVFVPERMGAEGTSNSSFHRQSSELSDSKASSVPETESISSAEDLEDKKPLDEDFSQESEIISIAEPEPISIVDHHSEHVGHGSESSDDEEPREEIEVKLRDMEDYQETVSETNAVATPMEFNVNETQLNKESLAPEFSSSSSSSEVDEEIFTDKEGDQLSSLEPLGGNIFKDPGPAISRQSSIGSNYSRTQHKEPVYDSSPTTLEKNLSLSSICSDHQVEIVEASSPPVLVDSEVSNQSIEKDSPAIYEEDDKPVSTHYQSPSEKIILSQSEKDLTLSGQNVDESSPENPEEPQDSTNYLKVLEIKEVDNRVQPHSNFPETLEATPMQSEVIETKACVAYSEDNILDTVEKVENGEQILALENRNFPSEATDSPSDMQNIIEDLNDMKEINEELLAELDAVGDFSVKDLRASTVKEEGEMEEASSIEHVDSPIGEIVQKEVKYTSDSIIINDEPLPEKAAPAEPEDSKLVQNPNAGEITSGMPVVEARFLDIKSAFNQIDENKIEKPVHDVVSPDETMPGYSLHEILHKGSISVENMPNLTVHDLDVVESRDPVAKPSEKDVSEVISVEDTNEALGQVSETLEKLPEPKSGTKSAEFEVNEVLSDKAIESSSEVSHAIEKSEDSRKSDVELKRANSHSSSSSSSSSSDSDQE